MSVARALRFLYDLPICAATCDGFSLHEAGVAGFENVVNEPCSTFFGAGCALYPDLWNRFFIADNTPSPPPPSPPRPPFGSATMRELPPTRVFFDGGMAAQMLESLDQYGSVEEAEAGMTSETFGSVASNRLWDGKGTTAIRPTNRWELKVDVHFATACDAVTGERLLANVVGDYVDAPFDSGKVSLYPQTASKGCEIWRFSTFWDSATSACRLRVRLRNAAKCNAYATIAAGDSVVLAATIADFEPRSTHSVVVRIKDPHVDTSTLGAPLGAAGVATTDGTEFEVYYDGVVLSDVDAASHPNLVFPNNQLPGGAVDFWFYTAYEAWYRRDRRRPPCRRPRDLVRLLLRRRLRIGPPASHAGDHRDAQVHHGLLGRARHLRVHRQPSRHALPLGRQRERLDQVRPRHAEHRQGHRARRLEGRHRIAASAASTTAAPATQAATGAAVPTTRFVSAAAAIAAAGAAHVLLHGHGQLHHRIRQPQQRRRLRRFV